MQKILLMAAVLNLATALIHTIMGHFDLMLPFAGLAFADDLKAILHACWHMVTVILFFSSLVFFFLGLRPHHNAAGPVANLLGILYIAFAVVFMAVGWGYGLFLPQVVLLLPIGVLAVFGARPRMPAKGAVPIEG